MADIKALSPEKYLKSLAVALKKSGDFPKPDWVDLVKSGSHKQRPINDEDFWYNRTASILRQVYKNKIVGVQRLRTKYGGRKDRGMRPPHFRKSGGKIIRTILQQTESAGFVEKAKGKKAGRQLTAKGKTYLEGIQP